MQDKHRYVLATGAIAVLVVGCATATGPASADLDQQALAMIQASFRDQGIAKVDRLTQDLGQAACSGPTPPPEAVAKQVEAQALATIRWPQGGQ